MEEPILEFGGIVPRVWRIVLSRRERKRERERERKRREREEKRNNWRNGSSKLEEWFLQRNIGKKPQFEKSRVFLNQIS